MRSNLGGPRARVRCRRGLPRKPPGHPALAALRSLAAARATPRPAVGVEELLARRPDVRREAVRRRRVPRRLCYLHKARALTIRMPPPYMGGSSEALICTLGHTVTLNPRERDESAAAIATHKKELN